MPADFRPAPPSPVNFARILIAKTGIHPRSSRGHAFAEYPRKPEAPNLRVIIRNLLLILLAVLLLPYLVAPPLSGRPSGPRQLMAWR